MRATAQLDRGEVLVLIDDDELLGAALVVREVVAEAFLFHEAMGEIEHRLVPLHDDLARVAVARNVHLDLSSVRRQMLAEEHFEQIGDRQVLEDAVVAPVRQRCERRHDLDGAERGFVHALAVLDA